MGLVNVPVVNQDDDLTPEFFNSRFGELADEINGNLDDDNIADNSIGTSKLVDDSVTAAKIEEQQAWVNATYTNSWTTYDTNFHPARYYKDSLGIVHLSGLVKNGTMGSAIFTLPAGYRPSKQLLFPTLANNSAGRIDVMTTGAVTPYNGLGTNGYITLEGITFRAEA